MNTELKKVRRNIASRPVEIKTNSKNIKIRVGSVEFVEIYDLRPHPRNARTHSRAQIVELAKGVGHFGFINPIIVTLDNMIVAGHGRVEAAKMIGMTSVPVIRIEHLSENDIRAYVIADNKLAQRAGWDREILANELSYLIEIGYDVHLTGFETPEIDSILEVRMDQEDAGDADVVPTIAKTAVSKLGDVWALGRSRARRHRVAVGDARSDEVVRNLMEADRASMMLTDPPYNVKVQGHVSGKGRTRHREFAMASGEMSEADFIAFTSDWLAVAQSVLGEGALLFVFMDWRHLWELQSAAKARQLRQLNLCVWNKNVGGMGSLYRSKHELVLVLKADDGSHRNNVELGKHGRNRTNVWDYAGLNTFKRGRDAELAMHPTVKPVAMLSDAIRDVTRPGDVVLDLFGGSGSTLIAAEQTGRQARLLEIDPLYVDVSVRRWQALTGQNAILIETGESYEDVAARRGAEGLVAGAEEGDDGR